MKTCLVVDDSAVIRKVAMRILDNLDLDVSEAEDCGQALAACERTLPDIAIIDSILGDADGCDVVRAIRRLPGGRAVKIVVSILESDVATIARLRHAGADTHMMKPFTAELLVETLEEVGAVERQDAEKAA